MRFLTERGHRSSLNDLRRTLRLTLLPKVVASLYQIQSSNHPVCIMQLAIGRDGAADRHTNRAGKQKKQMIPLLKLAIEAHGGLERWRQVHS